MHVKSFSLQDIKGFKELKFDLQRPDGSFAGWTVFVGGNASGKSTLLKGIAMAILGPKESIRLTDSPLGWVRKGMETGKVSIKLHWDPSDDQWILKGKTSLNPISSRICIHEDDISCQIPPPDSPRRQIMHGWFAAGYGPMRRLSGSSTESLRLGQTQDPSKRFLTLFREDAALGESEAWLKTLYFRWLENKNPETQNLIDGVKALLGDGLLPYGMQISRITVDHVYILDSTGLELPMRDLSDGCRGIYALVLDLIQSMVDAYGMDGLIIQEEKRIFIQRSGVVLIDEIEAHLHPTWQREIPEWLKRHFPNIQFLVTTHSPLVAQAADPNGAFILPSPGDIHQSPRAMTPTEYEKLRLGRAEKTLLGVAFGLQSVRSKWANQQIKLWKRLDAKKRAKGTLSEEEEAEHAHLQAQMVISFDRVQDSEVP